MASRFAPEGARAGLAALYAFDLELSRIVGVVSQQLMGEIRLAWWRESLEAVAAGKPGRHPVLDALAPLVREGRLSHMALEALIEARHADLDADALADDATRLSYIDGTVGAVMALAAGLLDPAAKPEATLSAGRAWGWAGLVRTGKITAEAARPHLMAALAAARTELKALPVAAFPAAAYATFAADYLKGRSPSELEKRLRLVWATAKGGI